MTAFSDTMKALDNANERVDRLSLIPVWAYSALPNGNIQVISSSDLILRFGDMTKEQTTAVRQDIAQRLTDDYTRRVRI